jgi:hypothetical protein
MIAMPAVAHELGAVVGQVDDDGVAAGPDGSQFGAHAGH